MASIGMIFSDADASASGIGNSSPFSVLPWAAYVLGAKHGAGTDYTNLMDFCGSQGDLIAAGPHSGVNDYDEALLASSYYDTPFTLAQHFAAGGGSASIVVVGRPSANACMWAGKVAATGNSRFYIQSLVASGVEMTGTGVVYDDANVTTSFGLAIPGTDDTDQLTMMAFAVTPTSIRGYIENSSGSATAAAAAKTSGTYTAPVSYRIGASQGVGSYPGPINESLILFFAGDQYAYFPTLYAEIKAWLNEHGLGL